MKNVWNLGLTIGAAALIFGCSKSDTATQKKAEPVAPTAKTAPATAETKPDPAKPSALAEAAGEYDVDSAHTQVIFRIKHLGVSYQYGRFNKVTGKLVIDAAAEKSSAEIQIDAKSVFTASKKRDTHLRSPDFFDVKQFPTIDFKSASMKKTGDSSYDVAGKLSVHGVTKDVTIPLEVIGAGTDPWGGYRVGFEGVVTLKRSDYGMSFMQGGLGDDVRLILSIEAIRK